jgi:hypothetical protein
MMSQEAQANRHLNGIRAVAASKASVAEEWRQNESESCGVVMTRRLPIEMQHVHPTQHGITKRAELRARTTQRY